MCVNVQYQDSLEAIVLGQVLCSYGDVIEEAEAAGAVLAGVVTRWTNESKSIFEFSVHHEVNGF